MEACATQFLTNILLYANNQLVTKGLTESCQSQDYINVATGLNWYLKYYAGIHLSWNGMKAELPDVLPPVTKKERRETSLTQRYN
ncbi:MAG: alpha-N-acetylglucosaminidase N-terminal domain-containing protein, partial [Bacteroides sp.]|nr:alpha-N-acetylglucosaminidase N-terminal domain-containing protein [Bacteroides sp.]